MTAFSSGPQTGFTRISCACGADALRLSPPIMSSHFRLRPPLTAALLILAAAVRVSSRALADQVVSTPQAPVVVIHSSAGLVTVARGDDGAVRVVGGDGPTASTFQITGRGGLLLPRDTGFPSRRLTLPGVREGTTGVRVDNPGGDMTVYVPHRVAAVLLKLDDGDAALSQFRGPYVVVSNGGSVDLTALFGFGHVRTTSGRVTIERVGGNLRVETTSGSVMATGMMPERAEIRTQNGDIDWTFARLGGGPYRFASGAGNVRLGFAAVMPANIDAQSTQGTVVNRFARTASVRFRSPHAMSMSLAGGGPEITATSASGIVEVGPRKK